MNNKFIIIEGPDNVGKSTLIRGLQHFYNKNTFQCLHFSNVKHDSVEDGIEYSKNLYTQMFESMSNLAKYNNAGMICDRAHLGEMVYGPIYRGYSGEYVLDIERKYTNYGPIWSNLFLITLYDEPENLIARDDGLSFSTDLDKKQAEINNFKNAHDKSLIVNKLLLNIKDNNAEQALSKAIEFIGKKDD